MSMFLFQDATEPEQGVFTFTEGDQIVNLAKQNGYLVRGHNLGKLVALELLISHLFFFAVWDQQLPSW